MDELQVKRTKKEFVDRLDLIRKEPHIEYNDEIINNYAIYSKSVAVKYLSGHNMLIMENELEGLSNEDILEFAGTLERELDRLKMRAEYRPTHNTKGNRASK